VADESTHDEKPPAKADHEPPAGAETTATWTGGGTPIDYTASAKWLVLRKKEKPAAEIFSVSYVAKGGDADRPVTFVFNGGPGASSAYLHLGAVGPRRVAFPADGTLPQMPPRLVQNDESWLAFTDLVFVDPVGTGFSRVIDDEQKDGSSEDKKKDEANDPKEYFGLKRDLESLCEFMARWLSGNDRWGSPIFVAGESYGGYRVGRLVRMLQESTGIGLNGAILISPALEIATLASSDYDVLAWVDLLPTMAAAATHHGLTCLPRRNCTRRRAARSRDVRHR
jgi:carboxypeptidase C (cathepsin A)